VYFGVRRLAAAFKAQASLRNPKQVRAMNQTEEAFRTWHHSPSHLFVPGSTYMVTAGTSGKHDLFDAPARLDLLLSALFEQAERFGWRLQAWAAMRNHYHFVATAPEDAATLKSMIGALHSKTAIAINKLDGTPGRKVWFQYWDSCVTYEKSYLARLHYVHQNPVKHGIVTDAEAYRWCSMGWFIREAESGFRKTVLSFPHDTVNVLDDF
jgi:putative transposase